MSRSSDDDVLRSRRTSPWSRRDRARRWLWSLIEGTLFRFSPQPCYRWRAWLLRRFGAHAPSTVRIRPTATIEVPWNLRLGEHAIIGDRVILYCLAEIRIGARSVVSQYAHLCAGTHDHSRRSFPLVTRPIAVGDDAWLAADVFVGPGVTIGDRTVVGARSNVFDDLPADKICVGSPALPVRDRILHDN